MSDPTTAAPPAQSSPPAVAPANGRAPITTAPCYCCAGTMGVPVGWTWWGWVLPRLLHHVKCVDCPVHYNAKTGESNDRWILALHLVYLVAGVALGVGLYFLFRR